MDIYEDVRQHPHQYTYSDLINKYKLSRDQVRGRIVRRGLEHLIVKEMSGPKGSSQQERVVKSRNQLSQEAKYERELRAHKHHAQETDRKYKSILDELTQTQKALDCALQIKAHKPNIEKIATSKPSRSGGTAVVCASDWHVEELVPSHKVNGLNEHNPDTSKRRAHRFFELVVRFIRIDRHETDIDNLVLWLGGDFFTSDSHGSPTAFPPMIAAMYAQDLLASGITFIREQEPNLNITIVGSVGNHSRKDMMKPVNQALEQEHSLEWMMYHALKARFESDKVKFVLQNSYHTYLKVEDKTLRFNHGHLGWWYNDGLGGIHGPLWKAISQKMDKQIKADLTICGHYHTYTPSALARGYIVNGSNIGATPYSLNFGYEPPSQAYFLVHSKYGIVNQRPLFVDS